jgi:hypothetical protein
MYYACMSTVSELGLEEPCLEMSIKVRRIFLKLRHGCKECQDRYVRFVQLYASMSIFVKSTIDFWYVSKLEHHNNCLIAEKFLCFRSYRH